MKVEATENGSIMLKEIYAPIGIKTNDGETIILMMRDSGFEICYENNWFSLQKGKIKSFSQIRKENEEKWFNKKEDPEDCLFEY